MSLINKNERLIYLSKLYILNKMRTKKEKVWTKQINSRRQRLEHGFYEQAYKLIKNQDDKEFRKITRMSVAAFELLATLLHERLTKKSRRMPIEPECRLLVTLMHLAQGAKLQTIAWNFRLGLETVRRIIIDTCDAIWEELQCIYLSPPNEDEWENIASALQKKNGLPHCVGCVDGKHTRIRCPPRSGSQYHNYKKYFSIVLLAVCDHNYCFTAVDIGAYGSQSDGGIMALSKFGSKILNGSLNLPAAKNITPNLCLPYYFVGDAAFPLRKNLMRPFPGRFLPADKSLFNETLSKTRCLIENTFGIMTMRWRVLLDMMLFQPKNAIKIVKAVVVLHNFVKMNDNSYCPPQMVDHQEGTHFVPGEWRTQVHELQQSRHFTRFNAPREAFNIRENIKNYLTQQQQQQNSTNQ